MDALLAAAISALLGVSPGSIAIVVVSWLCVAHLGHTLRVRRLRARRRAAVRPVVPVPSVPVPVAHVPVVHVPVPAHRADPVTGLLLYSPSDADDLEAEAVLLVEVDGYVMAEHLDDPEAGRLLLTDAAERIRAATADQAVVRRMTGPHFLVLVPTADDADLQDLASRMALLPDRPASTQAGALTVGIAVAPRDGEDLPALVRSARLAVAHATREYPGTAAFYDPLMAEEAADRFAVGRALRMAIDQRLITLAFQPQLDLATGGVVGAEVLARWTDSAHGVVSPARFIRVADQLGMGRALDRLILEQALAQLRAWDDAGVHVPRLSVNVSPDTLRARRIPEAVARMLDQYGIAPERLTVELIESRLLDEERGVESLRRLRDMGLRVSLDDFGTGYASFSQLVSLPIDELKIDRSFLSDSDDPVTSSAVVAAIVRVGQTLGLDVVAEGIERPDQEQLLTTLRCPVGQGYHYARPLTADQLVEWLTGRGGRTPSQPVRPAGRAVAS